jgi:hypothetical protein
VSATRAVALIVGSQLAIYAPILVAHAFLGWFS